jgi:hypothetical protein
MLSGLHLYALLFVVILLYQAADYAGTHTRARRMKRPAPLPLDLATRRQIRREFPAGTALTPRSRGEKVVAIGFAAIAFALVDAAIFSPCQGESRELIGLGVGDSVTHASSRDVADPRQDVRPWVSIPVRSCIGETSSNQLPATDLIRARIRIRRDSRRCRSTPIRAW